MKVGTYELGRALKAALPFVGESELGYVWLENGTPLRVIATDRVRMAVADIVATGDPEPWATMALLPIDVKTLLTFLAARGDTEINIGIPKLAADLVPRVMFWNSENALTLKQSDAPLPNWRKNVDGGLPGRFIPVDLSQLAAAFSVLGGSGHLVIGSNEGQPIIGRAPGLRVLVMPLASSSRNTDPETIL